MAKKEKVVTAPPAPTYDPAKLPPKPDRTVHDKLRKAHRYLQIKHGDLMTDQKALEAELKLAEAKEAKLQEECDLILDQLLAQTYPDGEIPAFKYDADLPSPAAEVTNEPLPPVAGTKRPHASDSSPSIARTEDKRQRLA